MTTPMTTLTDNERLLLIGELREYANEGWGADEYMNVRRTCNDAANALDKRAAAGMPREPTQEMEKAGWAACHWHTNGTNHLLAGGIGAIWYAMHDAWTSAHPPQESASGGAYQICHECARDCYTWGCQRLPKNWPEGGSDAPTLVQESEPLVWRNPAPDAAAPLVPTPSRTLTVGVGVPQESEAVKALRELWALWNDPKWCRIKADYMRGHLSYVNMLDEKERAIRAALPDGERG